MVAAVMRAGKAPEDAAGVLTCGLVRPLQEASKRILAECGERVGISGSWISRLMGQRRKQSRQHPSGPGGRLGLLWVGDGEGEREREREREREKAKISLARLEE